MNLDNLNKWLNLAANIGVIAGILLLAVEIRQNQAVLEQTRDSLLLDSSHLDVSRFTDWRSQQIANKEVAELFLEKAGGGELDAVDQHRFDLICNDLYWAAALMHERAVELGKPSYEKGTVDWMRQQLLNPALNDCWLKFREILLLWGYDVFVGQVENRSGAPEPAQ